MSKKMVELIAEVHAELNKNMYISVLCLILKPKRLSEVSKNFLILKKNDLLKQL